MFSKLLFVLGLLTPSLGIWQCTNDTDCSMLSGSACMGGQCACPGGTQSVLGGTVCAEISPYHYSSCVEDFQCSGLFTAYECRESGTSKLCTCQPSHHYFLGRCWSTIDAGGSCTRDEECLSALRDPYSLTCDGSCVCADGYYLRQRGECRRIGYAVGDGCVLNADCQFEAGLCDQTELRCYDSNNPATLKLASKSKQQLPKMAAAVRQHGLSCDTESPCSEPFICSQGVCVCPSGYYSDASGAYCLAELGSPVTSSDQCAGLFSEVRDGVCTCLANFYFDENMRDCVKAARTLSDACVSDANCLTFGAAARCGPPQAYEVRSCECDPELAVWDAASEMCKLFAGIGESCSSDSECLAGELEIQCVIANGQGVCACPQGYVESDGLCLTTGLDLGDACQSSLECTESPNTVCDNGRCSCDSSGYQEIDGACAPIIGGVCTENSDCVINNTICVDTDDGLRSCQCNEDYVEFEDQCWIIPTNITSTCEVSAQCVPLMGVHSACADGACVCATGHHYRDGLCWLAIGLFEVCSRTSECYLQGISERVVCRNSLCQCDFDYPYSEQLNTCVSSAGNVLASVSVLLASILLSLKL